jgi:hypothetical protein
VCYISKKGEDGLDGKGLSRRNLLKINEETNHEISNSRLYWHRDRDD